MAIKNLRSDADVIKEPGSREKGTWRCRRTVWCTAQAVKVPICKRGQAKGGLATHFLLWSLFGNVSSRFWSLLGSLFPLFSFFADPLFAYPLLRHSEWKGGLSVDPHFGTQLTRQPLQRSSKGSVFVRVRLVGVL